MDNLPGVFDRVKAAIIDGVILLLLIMLIGDILVAFETVPTYIRIVAFILIFLGYDPLLTSFNGGTIGHRFIGLRVKKVSDLSKNIPFSMAVLRFIVKALLGWISLLTISGSEKRQALHDHIANSIVIYENTETS